MRRGNARLPLSESTPATAAPPGVAGTGAVRRQGDILRGILLMCAGVSMFPFMNAAVKLLGTHYPVAQIVWARFTGHLVAGALTAFEFALLTATEVRSLTLIWISAPYRDAMCCADEANPARSERTSFAQRFAQHEALQRGMEVWACTAKKRMAVLPKASVPRRFRCEVVEDATS